MLQLNTAPSWFTTTFPVSKKASGISTWLTSAKSECSTIIFLGVCAFTFIEVIKNKLKQMKNSDLFKGVYFCQIYEKGNKPNKYYYLFMILKRQI